MAKRTQMPKKSRPVGKGQSKPAGKAASRRAASPTWLLAVVVGAVVLVVAGVIVLQVQSQQRSTTPSGQIGEGAAWGPAGAPVKIVEYSNFGCSFCKSFALGTGMRLRAEYEPTGLVRYEFKHLRLGSPGPDDASNAAECAADQGRFWDYHDIVFAQQGVARDPFGKAALKQYGAQLGLNAAVFNRCVDTGQHMDKVLRDSDQGRAQRVSGTPTFFVNGAQLVGDVPYDQFKAAIDAALAGAAK
jgi:protein-disulfide isomerase